MPETTEAIEAEAQEAQPSEPTTNTNVADINNLSLGDQVDDVDPEADADAVVLPPEGIYSLRVRAGDKGVYGPTRDKNGNMLDAPKLSKGKPFFVAELQLSIVSEDSRWDGMRIFNFGDANSPLYVTSLKNQRTNASSASDLAAKTGYPFKAGSTLDTNAQHLAQLLAGEPTIRGVLQWQATKETGETDEKGYAKRNIAIRSMKNFPPLRDKENNVVYTNGEVVHNPRMEDPRDGTELVGRAVITRFLPNE